MRRSIVTAAVLGVVLLAGTPALAAAPEIQQKSCEAGGGTFARDQGTKSCTTTTQTTEWARRVPYVIAYDGGMLTGVSSRTDVIDVATTQSQKGNGDVTSTQTATVVSSTVTPDSCTWTFLTIELSQPYSLCADNGALLRPLPLGPLG